MPSSDLHLATTILDPLCVPQTVYLSKFYSKYSISCKENITGMPVETTWSFHLEIRPHLAGHFRKKKNKDGKSTWSSRWSAQYNQEICSNQTSSSESHWTAGPWTVGENIVENFQYISDGLLSKIGQRVWQNLCSYSIKWLWHICLQTTEVSHAALPAPVLSDTQALGTCVLLTTETSERTCVLSQSELCPAVFL